jgi:hypothetical protein
MTDIHELLSLASEGDTTFSAGDDLNRARGLLIRRRRARARALTAGIGGLAAVAAVGLVITSSGEPSKSPSVSASPAVKGLHLVAADITGGSFSFGKIPDNWEVQRATESKVVMIPTGKPYGITVPPSKADLASGKARPPAKGSVPDLDSFEGKLLISFDQYPLAGNTSTIDGRVYEIEADSQYTTISVATLPGQPRGVVRVQYPTGTGWSQSTLREFLDSVTVKDSARPSV